MCCAIFLHGALSVWCWETVTVFCWCFWLNRFELDILDGKDKKDIRAHKSQTQTHTGQQKWAFIHCQGCVALLISLSFKKVCECGCAGMIYSQLLINIHQRVRAPQPTSLTFIAPIWQYRTPHSHHIGLTMEYVCVCVWMRAHYVSPVTQMYSINVACTVSTSSINRSEALWGEPKATLLLLKLFIYTCCTHYIRSRWQWKYFHLRSVLLW